MDPNHRQPFRQQSPGRYGGSVSYGLYHGSQASVAPSPRGGVSNRRRLPLAPSPVQNQASVFTTNVNTMPDVRGEKEFFQNPEYRNNFVDARKFLSDCETLLANGQQLPPKAHGLYISIVQWLQKYDYALAKFIPLQQCKNQIEETVERCDDVIANAEQEKQEALDKWMRVHQVPHRSEWSKVVSFGNDILKGIPELSRLMGASADFDEHMSIAVPSMIGVDDMSVAMSLESSARVPTAPSKPSEQDEQETIKSGTMEAIRHVLGVENLAKVHAIKAKCYIEVMIHKLIDGKLENNPHFIEAWEGKPPDLTKTIYSLNHAHDYITMLLRVPE